MNDDARSDGRQFIEGIEPVMDATPPAPDWESLQFDATPVSNRPRSWWVAPVAAAAVILVLGVGSFFLAGTDDSAADGAGLAPGTNDVLTLEGRWVLEAWQEGGDWIEVDIGENAAGEPWLEFTQTFSGSRESFVAADGTGVAGTFVGSTGCNGIRELSYEYSAGFLIIAGEVVVQAVGCEPGDAEEALLTTLWKTPDGLEVILGTDQMEWYGSNVEGLSYPLRFRRDGVAPPPPTTAAPDTQPVAGDLQVYDVNGVEVVTSSRLAELPNQATLVEFSGMIIDSGNGPEICLGGVNDSLPPQCSGPVASELDMTGWTEERNGVRWGERSIVVTWPPVNGSVETVADSGTRGIEGVYPPGELPAACADTPATAGAGPINEYAVSLGDGNGGLYLANDGTLVLQVVGDPEPHREALADSGGACVIEVPRSESEQRTIQDALARQLSGLPEIAGGYGISTGPGGRVEIYVPVADRATALAVAGLVDDPTALRVIGMSILHEGS